MLCSKGDRNALTKSLLQKVKMKDKGSYIYRGNGAEDEWTLWFEQLTIRRTPRVPTTLMALGQPVRLGMFLRIQVEPSLHRSVHSVITNPWSEGAIEEGKVSDDGSI